MFYILSAPTTPVSHATDLHIFFKLPPCPRTRKLINQQQQAHKTLLNTQHVPTYM